MSQCKLLQTTKGRGHANSCLPPSMLPSSLHCEASAQYSYVAVPPRVAVSSSSSLSKESQLLLQLILWLHVAITGQVLWLVTQNIDWNCEDKLLSLMPLLLALNCSCGISILGSPISYQCVKTLKLQKHPETLQMVTLNLRPICRFATRCSQLYGYHSKLKRPMQCCTKTQHICTVPTCICLVWCIEAVSVHVQVFFNSLFCGQVAPSQIFLKPMTLQVSQACGSLFWLNFLHGHGHTTA